MIRFCTSKYKLNKTAKKEIYLEKLDQNSSKKKAEVIISKKKAPLKDLIPIKMKNELFSFMAETSNGEVFQFVGRAPLFEFVEAYKTYDNENSIKMIGIGGQPYQPVDKVNEIKNSFLVNLIGFQQTIGDFREYWDISIDLNYPYIYLPGQNAGIFKQEFKILKLPYEDFRLFLSEKTPKGTYKSKIILSGIAPENVKNIISSQNSIKIKSEKKERKEFDWDFQAKNKNALNKSYLSIITHENENYRLYTEIFRYYQAELSFRLGVSSALANASSGSSSLLMNNELAFNYWFEDLWSSTDYYFSRQRWGTSFKHYQSSGTLALKGFTPSSLVSTTFDLKYRLTPGLWGRDESWGFSLNYNSFKYGLLGANFLGTGFFWARSLPRVFDNLFNYIFFLRYPKWVDLEYLIYPVSLSSSSTIASGEFPWSLNFHGKIFWTPQIFGEFGFGIKNMVFIQQPEFGFLSQC